MTSQGRNIRLKKVASDSTAAATFSVDKTQHEECFHHGDAGVNTPKSVFTLDVPVTYCKNSARSSRLNDRKTFQNHWISLSVALKLVYSVLFCRGGIFCAIRGNPGRGVGVGGGLT